VINVIELQVWLHLRFFSCKLVAAELFQLQVWLQLEKMPLDRYIYFVIHDNGELQLRVNDIVRLRMNLSSVN
jgi:hypothetical protein